jgi:hypothetical protein
MSLSKVCLDRCASISLVNVISGSINIQPSGLFIGECFTFDGAVE